MSEDQENKENEELAELLDLQKYEFEKKLGRGGFGIVVLASYWGLQRPGQHAVKMIKLEDSAGWDEKKACIASLERERMYLTSCADCPFVVDIVGYNLDKQNENPYIAMEPCETDMKNYLIDNRGKISNDLRDQVWIFILQLYAGLAFLRGNDIYRMDIKVRIKVSLVNVPCFLTVSFAFSAIQHSNH